MTTVECSPKEIGRRWFEEVWNQRNVNVITELLAPDARGHMEGGQEVVGARDFIVFHQNLLKAMPDLRISVRNVLSDGDDVCVHWEATATHTGTAFGIPSSGRKLAFNGMTWFRVDNGVIVEGWDCWNQGGLFAQMSQAV